ncbi:DNA gyrase subunit A [Ruminococcus callidus]|uniref:DNA gyrase subunit A n=1 Tax=Ruminococcus callidus TaxID=40519 RepID=UPI001D02C79E|nr:DNA gyrase subunit A [Ruminococcus callidus]MCB5776577.1 DNA gyrase subunit A [Ruminococcus callidus]MCC2760252.1 DNA gyrase subunit A [Ruminococcus callidus]
MEKENFFTNGKQKITPIEIGREMQDSFLQYAMSVIVARALPDVRDGLKPVHRRILYTMFEKGLTPDKAYHKCADTVGAVLGSYHPHGDASVYDALVRLAQNFSMRYMLVDGQGNFGSVDGDPPAAYRYTEARMSKIALEMLTDIHKETVPFIPNYDDRLKEPEVLPSRFPNILVNGSIGIAVGMATNIPPHNLGEVIDGIHVLIQNPDCTMDELMACIQGPDFPTGGIIMGRSGIRAAYATGRGKITLRGQTHFEKVRGRQSIIITEIPYMVNKARLIENIASLSKDKRIEGIYHIQDESSREGMRIVVELKKDANEQIVLNKLFSYTQLQDTVSVNMLALVNGEPKTLSLKQMLEQYLQFQVEVITNRTRFDLEKAKKRAHILQGFVVAIDHIDEVIAILRSSKTIPEGKERLKARFADVDMSAVLDRSQYDVDTYHLEHKVGLTDEQADAIVQMRLGALTGMERQKVTDELYGLVQKISDLIDILGDRSRVYQIIEDDLQEIRRKFGDARRTQIETVEGEVDIEDLIPVEDCVVTYTDSGYIKRISVDAYKSQRRGGRGVTGMKQREEDFVSELMISSSHANILFISNLGVMYKLKCYELPEGSKNARGTNIINLLPLSAGEKIAAVLTTPDFDEGKYVVMITRAGKIKRTALSAYKNVRKNGLIAIGLDEGDEIAAVRLTNGSNRLFAATRKGMAIRIDETDVRPMSRSAHGVKAITLRGDDSVVSMARERKGASLLTVTENGYGRRTALDEYRMQSRGGLGLTNYKVDAEHGDVCGIKVVDESDDLMFISSDGVIIRTPCDQIRLMGRVAKGVRVMRVNEGQRVVAFTRTEAAQDETPEADANAALVESAAPAEAQSVQPEAIPPKPENSTE